MAEKILVVAEQRGGALRKVTLELLSEGRRITDKTGGELDAALIGEGVSPLAESLSFWGVAKIFVADDPLLAFYTPDTYVSVLADLLREQKPSLVLLGATALGKDLAPRLAARLKAGYAADCVRLTVGEGGITALRPIYAGKAYAEVAWRDGTLKIATVRPNQLPLGEPTGRGSAEVIPLPVQIVPETLRSRVLQVVEEVSGEVDLTEAEVIVSGGRGMKGPENFALLTELAKVLGGAVGASRAAVDAGWQPHQRQVGQTGKVVSPKLYIACGISGAMQHLAGMRTSRCIVAINKDPQAPIFTVVNYGIVGDLFTVVPLLTAEFKKVLAAA